MRLSEVRRWASGRGIPAARFQRVYEGALLHSASRLLQAMYRESRVARLLQDAHGRWWLELGAPAALRAPASAPLPFRRIEITGLPWVLSRKARSRARTARAFLAGLKRSVAGTPYATVFDALRADFENSVANVVLNRLIGRSLTRGAAAIEPAYEGHHYYPFPALRRGPSVKQVLGCSNLCENAVDLPLIEIGACRLISGGYEDYAACMRSWAGLEPHACDQALLPMHPWQLRLSPIVRRLIASGLCSVAGRRLKAVPLASQRTCRILQTGFDVKLPIDATLTGEHRLLYRLNCENAPAISALARHVLELSRQRSLDFQEDVASILHAEESIAPHLSAIIRSPARAAPGERLVPAINLWAGRREARALLSGANRGRIEEFFHRYCRTLLEGPVEFCSQWGIAFEPHLQNVYVVLRDGLPTRIVLRDLDNSLLDAARVRPLLRDLRLAVAKDTWRSMPAFETAGKRLVQAMLFGHLGEAMGRLAQFGGMRLDRLLSIVDEVWGELAARAPSASARKNVRKLHGWSDAVKATLWTRLNRATTVEFVASSS